MEDMLKNITRGLHDASKTMLEANKANKAKSSAFRAGKKAGAADEMSGKLGKYEMSGRGYTSKDKDKATAAKKEAKETAKDKAEKMKLSAKDKLRSLGRSSREVTAPFNKGKEVHKAGRPETHKADDNIRHNVGSKEWDSPEHNAKYKADSFMKRSGQNRGKFLQMHHHKQHDIVRRKIEDLHNDIRNKLHDMQPKYDAHEKEGGKAIDTAKAHLAKLQKIHSSINEDAADEAYTELVTETLALVEEVVVLAELYGDKE